MKTNPKTLCSKILKRECPVELPFRKAPRYFVIFSSLIWSLIDVSKPFYKKVTWKLDQNDVEIICDYNRSKIIIMTPSPPFMGGPCKLQKKKKWLAGTIFMLMGAFPFYLFFFLEGQAGNFLWRSGGLSCVSLVSALLTNEMKTQSMYIKLYSINILHLYI